MNDLFPLSKFAQIIIYAIAVGLSIRVFSILWKFVFNIDTGNREAGLLAGAVIGLLVGLLIYRGPYVAGMSSGFIIVGYFILKITSKYLKKNKRAKSRIIS
jgi:hypothetical protein